MSQPASLEAPRRGEVVLRCPHYWRRGRNLYVGHEHGLGIWIKASRRGDVEEGGLWVRWVVLCRWCDLWRRLLRRKPQRMASERYEWMSQ